MKRMIVRLSVLALCCAAVPALVAQEDNDSPPASPPNTNPPPVVTVVATHPNAAEDGPVVGTLTVTRAGDTNNDLTVFYSLSGTAYNGSDYQMLPGYVKIPAGSTSTVVTVTPIADRDPTAETNETVVLQLRGFNELPHHRAPTYTLGWPSNAVVTITETTNAPAPPPAVTVAATKPNASEDGPTNGVFTVTRAGSTNNALTVYYKLEGGAMNGVDFQKLPGLVTIPAGASNATVTVVPILDQDPTKETNETVVLQLRGFDRDHQNPDYLLGSPSNAVVTIAETTNAPASTLPVITVTATQPNASEVGPTNGVFTLQRAGNTNDALTIYFSLSGTAKNGADYKMLPGYVKLAAGETNGTVTVVPIADVDLFFETNETVVLQLHPLVDIPEGRHAAYTVGSPSNAVVTIAESPTPLTNPPPVVTVVATHPFASEAGPTNGTFTITRNGSTNVDLTVRYSLGGTAANGPDYQDLPNSVTIPAGSFSADVTVIPILDYDPKPETNETVVLQLRPVDADFSPPDQEDNDERPILNRPVYVVGWPSNAVVTIAESPNAPTNPPPVVTIKATDPVAFINVAGGVTNNARFVVHRSDGTNADLTVHYAISGSASNGVDYAALPPAVLIPAGQSSATITLVPLANSNRTHSVTAILTLLASVPPSNTPPAYVLGRARAAAAVILNQPPEAEHGHGHGREVHRLVDGSLHVSLPTDAPGFYRLESSTNLVDWSPVVTIQVSDSFDFVDPDGAQLPKAFYRIVPEPNPQPGDN